MRSHDIRSSPSKAIIEYNIFVIYEDGTTYESVISSQKDVDKIPKNKGYEAMKIMYVGNREYSHQMYGKDNVYLKYYDNCCLHYSQFDDSEEANGGPLRVTALKGIGKEDEFVVKDKGLPKTFVGKLLEDESVYLKMRSRCENYWPPV